MSPVWKQTFRCLLLAAVAMLPAARAAAAPVQSHFWLAAHHDWDGKKGYFLVLENFSDAGTNDAKLSSLHVLLGVADGHDFRYLKSVDGILQFDKDYTARAVINAGKAEVYLDGKRVAEANGGYVPVAGLQANVV